MINQQLSGQPYEHHKYRKGYVSNPQKSLDQNVHLPVPVLTLVFADISRSILAIVLLVSATGQLPVPHSRH